MIPDFREKSYNKIEIVYETPLGSATGKFIYDPKNNKILIRNEDTGADIWIPIDVFLKVASWPIGRTGAWYSLNEYTTKVSEEEAKRIYENTILE